MKKVSIIVPLYNASQYIEECLDSCFRQNYANYEVIVINDGSTDDSAEKIKPYLDRIKYVYQENMGGSAARNSGLNNASGEYVYFLDADDAIFPNTISKLVTSIEKDNSDLCIGAFETMDAEGKKGATFSFRKKSCIFFKDELSVLFSAYPNPSTKLFRMDVIRKNKLRFEDLRLAQDLNFYFRYLMNCNKVTYIDAILYRYRITNGSISTSYDKRILDIIKAFRGVELYARIRSFPLDDIQNVKYAHVFFQMTKTRYMGDARVRRKVFHKLAKELRSIPVSKGALTYDYIRNDIVKSKILLLFGSVYTSRLMHWVYRHKQK